MEKFCVRNENKGTVLPWLCISSTIIYFSYFVPSFLSQIPFLVLGVVLIWNTTLSYHLALEPNITHMLVTSERSTIMDHFNDSSQIARTWNNAISFHMTANHLKILHKWPSHVTLTELTKMFSFTQLAVDWTRVTV